jgi:hypothetical protein
MKLKDFATLTDAQAYTENKTKMISPDVMLSFLTQHDHIDLLDAPSKKESKALKHAFSFGSEFNLIDGHPLSVRPMLDQMVTDTDLSEAFRDAVVAYANQTTNPFASATQAEFDKAKAQVDTVNHTTEYPAELSYLVKLANKTVKLFIYLDAPATYDTSFTLYVHETPDAEVYPYVKRPQPIGQILVKAGESAGMVEVKKSMTRKCQFSSTANYIEPHKLVVQEA